METIKKINSWVEFAGKMQAQAQNGPFANKQAQELASAKKPYIVASVDQMKERGVIDKNVASSKKRVIWGLLKNTITQKWEISPLR